jgi:hypothetical protein
VDGRIELAIGKPWVALATGPEAFDCWGFVRYALDLSDAPDAPFLDEASRSEKMLDLSGSFRRVPAKSPYSICMMGKRGVFSHVGVYHPNGFIYHCIEQGGVRAHLFRKIGILGFDTFEFFRWGPHDNASRQDEPA